MSPKILCIGSVLIDELFFCDEPVMTGTSNPARMQRHIGGVISNIALNLHQLGQQVSLLTVVGNDEDAQWISRHFNSKQIDLSASIYIEGATGRFSAMLQPDGSLFTAACMDPVGTVMSEAWLESQVSYLLHADLIVMDTNPRKEVIQWVIDFCRTHEKQLIIETVSVAKAGKLSALNLEGVFMLTPNEDELKALHTGSVDDDSIIHSLISKGVKNIWVKKGSAGSVFYDGASTKYFDALNVSVIDTTGAGDSALAAWIAGYCHLLPVEECVMLGHLMATEILKINGTIHPSITYDELIRMKN